MRARKLYWMFVAFGAAALVRWWPTAAPPVPAPVPGAHVVLIVVDTLRADHLGAWGYSHDTSPNLDGLARGGVRFASAYSASSWTRPGMATLLTGLYPRQTGVYEEQFDVLPDEVTTLAERLRDAGYLTLGLTSNPNINAWFGFDQGFDAYLDSLVLFPFMKKEPGYTRFQVAERPLVTADQVTDQTLALVDAHLPRLHGRPLYLQALYVDPHWPYSPPEAAVQAMGPGTWKNQDYDGEVRFADQEIGRLLHGLEARGLLQSALVVFTSDHGEGLDNHPGLPRAQSHGHTIYDTQLHVPLVFSRPDLAAGTEVIDPVSSVDVLPTVLELVGLGDPALPGTSLAAVAKGGEADLPRYVFAETDWRYASKTTVRTARYKLIRNPDCAAFQRDGTHEQRELGPAERQMLERIPPEEHYLRARGRGEYPGGSADVPLSDPVIADLTAALQAWEARTTPRPPQGRAAGDVLVLGDGTIVPTTEGAAPRDLDDATREALEALGYLGD